MQSCRPFCCCHCCSSSPLPSVPTRPLHPALPPQRSRLLEANYLTSYVDRASERSKKTLKEVRGSGSGSAEL